MLIPFYSPLIDMFGNDLLASAYSSPSQARMLVTSSRSSSILCAVPSGGTATSRFGSGAFRSSHCSRAPAAPGSALPSGDYGSQKVAELGCPCPVCQTVVLSSYSRGSPSSDQSEWLTDFGCFLGGSPSVGNSVPQEHQIRNRPALTSGSPLTSPL
jgi:hypothetical protein